MTYDVDWLPSAVNRLTEIYLNALDKRAVTEASHRIDVILSMNADSQEATFKAVVCSWCRRSLSCFPLTRPLCTFKF
jgi:hypothetical protein